MLGCAGSPAQRLQGKWIGDAVEHFEPGQVANAVGWVRGASFEFRGARVTVTIPTESPREGTFRVTRSDKDEVSIAFLKTTGQQDEATFRFDAKERLHWQLGDGRSVMLRKAND
ncbi:MAG: hypothetical protein EXR75_10700 [Myxococcales bacterium]|nr:hypothetical protein [Myxococcales bacterium]